MTDWRLPEHRREVFLDFYEFHLRYRSHPGGVYYLMPYLRDRFEWNEEQALWFAFINGNTQNPITSMILMKRFPSMSDATKMIEFYKENYNKLEFDTDRRYAKKKFPGAIDSYRELTAGAQEDYWHSHAMGGFSEMWRAATSIYTFGRLSAFSYLEYLRIMGVPFDCDTLMVGDKDGSRSHRNGLCIVEGLDQYDWHKSNPDFDGNYAPELITKLEQAGASLLAEMKDRAKGTDWEYDVSYFTLESTLCTYKSWHRPNRRYPNVYNDMMYNRIKKAETVWGSSELKVFWEAREYCLPPHLRLEDNPEDLGLHPLKQNYYLTTGKVIMMQNEYPKYENRYEEAARDFSQSNNR
jgi:hypothetical protein